VDANICIYTDYDRLVPLLGFAKLNIYFHRHNNELPDRLFSEHFNPSQNPRI
jgi:hypothetical protein